MKNSEQPINPTDHVNNDGTIQRHAYWGLTKREYFAAMRKEPIFGEETLTLGWAKTIMGSEPPKEGLENIKWWIAAHEKFSLMRADALLAELDKTN